jgi:hypothetical protein
MPFSCGIGAHALREAVTKSMLQGPDDRGKNIWQERNPPEKSWMLW